MSSAKIRFETSTPPQEGRFLELSVNWPVALNGRCPLKLVLLGQVVASSSGVVTLEIARHEFKTRGSGRSGDGC
jgi:hypothetical protein